MDFWWYLDTEEDGQKTLYAPNGEKLFTIDLDTLGMLGRMFLDEMEEWNRREERYGIEHDMGP